jgi:exopolyphosphatase/pppGpp-phosphohydrolase
MPYTYEELKHRTIDDLREIVKSLGPEALPGHSQLNKEHLLPALCKALGIDAHVHHQVVGIDKSAIKAKLRQLKSDRDSALAAHDHARLHDVRRQIHHLKHQIHAAAV